MIVTDWLRLMRQRLGMREVRRIKPRRRRPTSHPLRFQDLETRQVLSGAPIDDTLIVGVQNAAVEAYVLANDDDGDTLQIK